MPDALSAMHHGCLHAQPLWERVLARHHDVDIVAAAQAVIEDRQQAIRVRRQVHAHDIGFFVDHVIEKAGILMRETIVVLLPDVRRKQIV